MDKEPVDFTCEMCRKSMERNVKYFLFEKVRYKTNYKQKYTFGYSDFNLGKIKFNTNRRSTSLKWNKVVCQKCYNKWKTHIKARFRSTNNTFEFKTYLSIVG